MRICRLPIQFNNKTIYYDIIDEKDCPFYLGYDRTYQGQMCQIGAQYFDQCFLHYQDEWRRNEKYVVMIYKVKNLIYDNIQFYDQNSEIAIQKIVNSINYSALLEQINQLRLESRNDINKKFWIYTFYVEPIVLLNPDTGLPIEEMITLMRYAIQK